MPQDIRARSAYALEMVFGGERRAEAVAVFEGNPSPEQLTEAAVNWLTETFKNSAWDSIPSPERVGGPQALAVFFFVGGGDFAMADGRRPMFAQLRKVPIPVVHVS